MPPLVCLVAATLPIVPGHRTVSRTLLQQAIRDTPRLPTALALHRRSYAVNHYSLYVLMRAVAFPCGVAVTYTQVRDTLATSSTSNLRVTTYEESARHADATGTPAEPFFVSNLFTPRSVSYVAASGMVYTPISMSYTHRFSNASTVNTEDTPVVTEDGDVSDVLWPAVNARLQSKWSRSCVQTADCEYYRSSVEAVFVSFAIPDHNDWAILRPLVMQHL